MKQINYIVLLLSFVASHIASANELDNVKKYGGYLTEAVRAKETIKLKKLPEYKQLKEFLKENKCPGFKYKAYKIGPEGEKYLYLVAFKGKNVIVGRHFKAPIIDQKISMAEVESSTRGCLDLGNPKAKNVAGLFTTHLKPLPNEFHLLQSNLRDVALYVGTSAGMFTIKDGTIEEPKKD